MKSEKNVDQKIKSLLHRADKRIVLIVAVVFVVMLIGASYAFFTFNKEGTASSVIVAGNIKMKMNSTNLELGDEMYPMSSADGMINGVKYSFSVNGYNESKKDIYYGVYINNGDEQSGKVRLNDSDIMMVLNETVNGETKMVYGPGSLADFNNSLIHANMVSSGVSKNEGVAIDYELTAWVSEKVLITNTETDVEGRSIYTQEDYANSYASLKVTVVGDFSEKTAQDGTVGINAYTKSDQIAYITNLAYSETPWVSDEVIVNFEMTKEPSKLVVTNELTNVKEELIPVKSGDVWTYQREETASGKYTYYVEYQDGKRSDIFHYNVRIDKETPTFTMEAGKRIKASNSDGVVAISNVVSGIRDESGVKIKYALIEKGEIVVGYKTVNNNTDNYEIKENVLSGIYELHVVATDASGKEYHDYVTYEITYDLPLVDTLQVSEKNTIEVIKGQQINYIESLKELNLDSYTFLGWSSDQTGSNIVTNQTIVTDEIKALYANWYKNGSDLIVTFVGNGATINKESDTCFAESGGSCTVNLPTITRDGYEIIGWATNKDSHSGITGEVSVSADATYYAITKKTIGVTFELNGAASLIKDNTTTSVTMTETCDMYNEETSCDITSLGITGSANTPIVVGWNETIDGYTSTWDVEVSKSFSESATYYAQTKKEAVVKTATYELSTGISTIGKTNDSCTISATYNGVKQAESCSITLPSITAEAGYNVLGWYEGSTKVGDASDTFPLTADKTLTATASSINISSTIGTTTYGDGEEIRVTVSGTNYGTLTCGSSDDSVGTCNVSGNTIIITPGNAGTAEITISSSTAGDVTYKLTVNKRSVTYTAGSTSRAYNGSALTNNTASLTSGSLANGHTATFSISGSITNVGSVTNTLSSVTIKNSSGTDVSSNYNITKVNGTLTVTRASVSKPSATNYCNTSLTYNGSSQTLTKTAGTGYSFDITTGTVAGTHEITATLNNNYQWSDGTRTAVTFECSIAKRSVTYTAGSSSRAYNGSALTNNTATLTSGSLVDGHTATFSISGSITNVGSVTNTLSSVTINNSSGTDVSSNYNITKVNGILTVTQATATKPSATSHCNTLTYNGSFQTLTKTAGTGYSFDITTGTNATTYTITASLASNYKWSDGTSGNVSFECTIAPLSVDVVWGSTTTFDYDGNEHAPTASATGVSGETLSISRTTERVIGTHTSVATLVGVTGGQGSIANYTLTNATKSFTIRIGERTYTATFYRNGAASIGGTTSDYLQRSCTIAAGNTATTCNVTSPLITGSTNTPTVIGWSTNSTTHTSSLAPNTAVAISGNIEYYAQTSGNATYSATFNLNGATSMTYNGTTYTSNAILSCTTETVYNGTVKPTGCTITLPTIARSGYSVSGWGNSSISPSVVYPVGGQLNVSSAGGTYYAITALGTTNLSGCTTDSWESGRCIYKGSDPSNYIYFNCTDEATRSGCEVWRIYSRESDGTLRVVNLSGKFSYTYSSDATDSTTWANSGTKTHLNGTYYSGLKTSAKGRMVTSVYKYGSYSMSSSHTINNIVSAESSSDTTTVGLLRLSELIRASSNSNIATATVGNSSTADSFRGYNSPARYNNWLSPADGEQYWSSTKSGTTGTSGLTLYDNSSMIYARSMTSSAYVIPVVTLDKGILLGGSGTSSDPYYIDTSAMAGTTSAATCSISVTNPSTYETSKTLTMSVSTNGRTLASSPYMWSTIGTWGTSNTTSVSQSGVITGYIKDTFNTTNKCTVSLTSRTEYRKQDCASFSFDSWGNGVTHIATYRSGQVPSTYTTYTQAYAEANNEKYFYYVFQDDEADSCDAVGGVTPCYHVFRRSRSGSCIGWGAFGAWQTSSITSTWKRNVETRTTYAQA